MTSISDMSREDLLTMIRSTVWDEIQAVVTQEVSDWLDCFEQQLTQLPALQQHMCDVTAFLDFTSKKLEDLKSPSLPSFCNHVERIADALAMQTLDLDMHRRKWSLTISGLKCASGEGDVDTRDASVQDPSRRSHLPCRLPSPRAQRRRHHPEVPRPVRKKRVAVWGEKTWKDTLTPFIMYRIFIMYRS